MRRIPALLLLSLAAVGCGSEPEKATVTGKVTGIHPHTGRRQAVVMGQITFLHIATDKQYITVIQPDGTYAVDVPLGEVKIFLESPQPDAEATAPPDPADPPQIRPDRRKWIPIPDVYSSLDTTPLKLEVRSNLLPYDIELPRGEGE